MVSSNLRNLLKDLLSPLQHDPDSLLLKVLGPANFYKLNGLLKNPITKVLIPPAFNPQAMIAAGISKFEEIPIECWAELESVLAGVIAGDEEQLEKARKLLGGINR